MNRPVAALLSLALVVVTAWPVVRAPYEDGFPLSPYPMFAFARPTKLTMHYPLGVTSAGGRRYLSPRLIGSGEVLQAMKVVARERASGTLPRLCTEIARRVAGDADLRDVVAIRFVTGTHDAVDFLVRDVIGPEVELARCMVVR